MLTRLLHLLHLIGAPTRSLSEETDSLVSEREDSLLGSVTMANATLWHKHPPQPEHANKKRLLELPGEPVPAGQVTIERWDAATLPKTYVPYAPSTRIVPRRGHFRYLPDEQADQQHWFMNFAHHDAFCCYPHFQFAQDEIQVAEHPLLASVREHLCRRQDQLTARCVEHGSPRPLLIHNVPRQLNIETREIYGQRFARADDELLCACTHVLHPATVSNILAIEAPVQQGHTTYSLEEITYALQTAYSGFRSVVLATVAAGHTDVTLHTGNWGCGAYGGNRQLMLSVQLLAARMAGVATLIVYCGTDSKDDIATFDAELTKRFRCRPGTSVAAICDRLAAARFPWGTSDGN